MYGDDGEITRFKIGSCPIDFGAIPESRILFSSLLLPTLLPFLLLIASLLLLFLERKAIGLAQKRLGISFLGRNG